MTDSFWGRDTSVAAATIPTNLSSAKNELHRQSFFITQSLAIPFNFFRKNRDSIKVGEGTVAYIGHSGEFTRMSKTYTDEISTSATAERAYYNNRFYINPTVSNDSLSYMTLDNKAFIKLQPFGPGAIIARINGGVGYEYLNYYNFNPQYFLSGNKSVSKNNLYVYAEADGMFKNYFSWDANARYTYAGYNVNDFNIDGHVKLAFFPFKGGITLKGTVSESLRKPDWFSNHLFTNHSKWENDFGKISETRFQLSLDIPIAGFHAAAGYALVNNMIYYDSLSVVRQTDAPVSVLSALMSFLVPVPPRVSWMSPENPESLVLISLLKPFRINTATIITATESATETQAMTLLMLLSRLPPLPCLAILSAMKKLRFILASKLKKSPQLHS